MNPEGFLPVRSAERRVVLASAGVLFLILAGHSLVETARDALFLGALPVERLPWVYLLVALLGPVVASLPLERVGRRGLVATLLGSAGVLVGLWALVGQDPGVGAVALYVWAGLAVSVLLVQVWNLVSQQFTVDAAKRVFGLVGAGSVVGAMAGAMAGGALAMVLPVRHLLLVAAVLTALAALGVPALGGRREATRAARSMGFLRDLRAVVSHPYARRIVALVAVATAAFTLVDFLFKAAVDAHVATEDLGAWFAGFYTIVNGIALAIQLLVTGSVIQVLGVRRAAAVLPLLLLLGGTGLAVGGGVVAALLLKGAEGSLKHTLHRTALEVLYVPVPASLRARIRRISDLLLIRLSQGLGSGLILLVLALGGGSRSVSVLAMGLAGIWLLLTVTLREHYLALFRGIVARGSLRDTVRPATELDLSALEALLGALNSDDDAEVLASLDLLDQASRIRLVPSLLLYHPSEVVVVRALDLFRRAGREDHLPKAERLARAASPAVRAAVVRTHPNQVLVLSALSDSSPVVRCTALAALMADGGPQAATVAPDVRRIVADGQAEERIALARALAQQAHSPIQVQLLAELAQAPTSAERSAVAETLAASPVHGHIPTAIQLLATRAARRAARRTLVTIGPPALPRLAEVLFDPTADDAVRIQIPQVMAEVGGPVAAESLVHCLQNDGSGRVRYRALRGLNRLHGLWPSLPLPVGPLEQSARREIKNLYWLMDWRILLQEGAESDPRRRTAGQELLSTLLRDKESSVRERLFRILDLLHAGEDFEDLWRGVLSENPEHRASSLELLEATLPLDLRVPARGLFDPSRAELPRVRRLAPGSEFYTPFTGNYNALIEAMLKAPSDSVQAVAAWHAGELGRVDLLPVLRAKEPSSGSALGEVVTNAIARLESLEPTLSPRLAEDAEPTVETTR